MILLLVGLVYAADCDPAAVLDELRASGPRELYLCVSKAEEGKDLLVAELLKEPAGSERLTRALVLWLLERTDRPMDPDLLARLSPSDRRLLADGIRARRGRASPSPDHAEVFRQLPWYAPVPGYNDARLRPVDRANLDAVDPAVRLVPPPAEPGGEGDADAGPAEGRVSAQTPNLCGCGPADRGGLGFFAVALAAALVGGVRRVR
ncbi:MAG: YARHG domain-containing protein [Pseudomonadota bacterium]|nr:YARHG domain-containing protein [Pseudomonadota bacterium]